MAEQREEGFIPDSLQATFTDGHEDEVLSCAWNPRINLLATRAVDFSARLWDVTRVRPNSRLRIRERAVLEHCRMLPSALLKYEDVTSFCWNSSGTQLVSFGATGRARMWDRGGTLLHIFGARDGPIFDAQFNRRGNCIASAGIDGVPKVWDVMTGFCKEMYPFHTGIVLSIDWRDNTCFASGSEDTNVFVWNLNSKMPIMVFVGHNSIVRVVKWNPRGNLLASCSMDKTIKIWSLRQRHWVHNLTGHSDGVLAIKWCPTGPGNKNPNARATLASAGLDGTVRLWDVDRGVCVYTMEHTDIVTSLAFSPNGMFLASGSMDRYVHIWSTRNGRRMDSYQCTSQVNAVSWNARGDKIAVAEELVHVLDVHKLR